MTPLLILALAILIVVGMIVGLRINAFVALITAAILVSLLAPGPWSDKVARVATAFGSTAGSIGIVIAMAAVIGITMMASGAADRVVQAFLSLLGQNQGGTALTASGFVLSVPVFFDTVFYLLIPLARSMYRHTGGGYLGFVMAISAGAAATHSLVPPTPGPLIIADNLGIDLGTMMLIGTAIALPAAVAGFVFAIWVSHRMPVPMRSVPGEQKQAPLDKPPALVLSLAPILLPVLLISGKTILAPMAGSGNALLQPLATWFSVLGDPNLALLLAAFVSVALYIRVRRPTRTAMGKLVEQSLQSGGIIILITAAGGTFGAMLKEAQIGPAIQGMLPPDTVASGLLMLAIGFGMAALLKFAQGSSTVAMITASAMVATMVVPGDLGFHVVYLGTAIGSGALVGSWMNDSGFWIYSKMGGITEAETLKSWTPLLAIMGVVGGAASLLMALFVPLV